MRLRENLQLCAMMMVVVMMVMVYSRHHLRLRRDRNREAEDKNETNQKLLHALLDEIQRSKDYLHLELRFSA